MNNLDLTGNHLSENDYWKLLRELQSEDTELDESVESLEHIIDELTDTVGTVYDTRLESATGLSLEQAKEIEDEAIASIDKPDEPEKAITDDEEPEALSEYEAYVKKAEQVLDSKLARAENARAVKREKKRKERILKIEIQRKAFAQNQLDLSQLMPIEHMQLLVSILTQKYQALVKRYDEYINKRFTLALRKHIPYQLRVYRKAYPQAFKENPGFMYTASKEYGGGYSYWVTPDLPYYIKQFTEIDCIKQTHANWLPSIDSYIARRFKTKEKLDFYEMKYATRLANLMPNHTYFELLKHHPFWFILLYEKVTGYSLGVSEKVAELQPYQKGKMRLIGAIC